MNELQKKLLADPNFGDGSLLMRPEDTSIQGASEDFMQYLQNPTEQMTPPAPVSNPSAIEDFGAIMEQDAIDKSLKAPVATAPQTMSKSSSISSNIGSTPPTTPPASTPQDDILAQLRAARDANEASINAARQKDKSTELGNLIMKSGAMAGEGIVNRAGNTNIKLSPAQIAAEEANFVGSNNKSKLEALMQDYGLKKGMDDTAYNRKKDEQARNDRNSDKAEERAYRNRMLDIAETKNSEEKAANKDERKEEMQIKKENRKTRRDMDEAEKGLEAQLKLTEDASKQFENYSKNKVFGTGQIATGFGLKQYLDKDTEALKNTFGRLGLNEMTTKLKGFGGAVNSEGERKIFEATIPNTGLDDDTNRINFKSRIEAMKSSLSKIKQAKNKYDRNGNFTDSEDTNIPQNDVVQPANKIEPKSIISKQYSPSRDKTKITYSDGSTELIDGKK